MTKSQKRDKYLQKKYGITLKQYNKQLKKQGYACWICKKPQSEVKYALHQDHNHKTGLNRGILCYFCNRRRVGRHNLESAQLLYNYMLEFEGGKK